MPKQAIPDHHVFHDPIAGKIVVAGETLINLQTEANRRGFTLDRLWMMLVAEEERRIQHHLENN